MSVIKKKIYKMLIHLISITLPSIIKLNRAFINIFYLNFLDAPANTFCIAYTCCV